MEVPQVVSPNHEIGLFTSPYKESWLLCMLVVLQYPARASVLTWKKQLQTYIDGTVFFAHLYST